MAGGLSNRNFRISMAHMPDPKRQYTIDFSRLDGGLNLYDLDYRLNPNESPDMKNLRWKDGALGCRDGQEWLIHLPSYIRAVGAYSELFWDYAFVHCAGELRCFCPYDDDPAYTTLATGLLWRRGTFFRYGDYLMYKCEGTYLRIRYDPDGTTPQTMFLIENASSGAFVPVTYINTNPTTMAGTAYQPENRLTRRKTIWYSAEQGVDDYFIPYGSDEDTTVAVETVIVDGATKTEGTDFTVTIDSTNKTVKVHFTVAPPVSNPFVANTVRITYRSNGTEAYNSVMDCPYATVYGGDQNLCVVVGGCHAQPNAYFWSGNDELAMNPFYFPMEHYNFAGDTESAVMGFGKQQGFLVIFSKKGIGRAGFGTTTTTSSRLQIEMPYTAINARIGCDFPWSIELVENNLVFLNSEHGMCYLADSSAAYENNVIEFSRKINGSSARPGLFYDVFSVSPAEVVSTVHDDQYWIVANGHAYVWDFRLSSFKDPTWFYYTNINEVAFVHDYDQMWGLHRNGHIVEFVPGLFSDFDQAIDKVYQFATQMMGSYDRLKNVVSVIFVLRSDTDTVTQVQYITDYETRYDLTPLRVFSWRLVPRNLAYRFLGVTRFAAVHRRKPMCRHVRHFAMRLENNEVGHDLDVISAQVFYNYQGVQR